MARGAIAGDIEALPEADCLDGAPHPRETRNVFGHSDAERTLAAGLASGRMHHAWLLSGPQGIGKATLAYKFARAALSPDGDRDMFSDALTFQDGSATERQIIAQSHPGLLVIRRPYDTKTKRHIQSIPVDEVRRLKGFLALTAEGNARRVVIVDSADELNANAANALLKSLEEPPMRTIFMLVSSQPGRLLPTIRSRCRSLALPPLNHDDLAKAVAAVLANSDTEMPSGAAWARLAGLSGGSVRRALALIEGGGLALQAKIDAFVSGLPKGDFKSAHQLADDLSGPANEQRFQLFFELLDETLARLVRLAAVGGDGGRDDALADRVIGSRRLATFSELWETLARDKAEAMALNLDRKALILNSLGRLQAAANS